MWGTLVLTALKMLRKEDHEFRLYSKIQSSGSEEYAEVTSIKNILSFMVQDLLLSL